MKSQADSLVAMQNQLANIQQFCMAVGQQPLSSVYAPAQQQLTFNNRNKCNGGGQSSGRGFPQQPTMSFCGTGGGQQRALCPPTQYKCWENWNYCHTHSSDVADTHTSAICGKPGPTHNPTNASCTNIWADRLPECTRPSCPWLAVALHPIVTHSSSSSCSNVCPLPNTHLEAPPGSYQLLLHSSADCHQPAAPTASR
jgi:hypothetical protein